MERRSAAQGRVVWSALALLLVLWWVQLSALARWQHLWSLACLRAVSPSWLPCCRQLVCLLGMTAWWLAQLVV